MEDLTLSFSEALVIALGAMGMGMILLVKGGNWTVDAAVYLAKHWGISPLLVGLTIVAFGTSLPELIVSVNANLQGLPGIALGNVIGSNVANILLILGVTGCLTVLVARPKDVLRDLCFMMAATVLLMALMLHGDIGTLAGFGMIAILVLYTGWEYRRASIHGHEVGEELGDPVFNNLRTSLLFLLFGLIGIAVGAEFLVRGAKTSAQVIGVPDAVIALSVIAIGTSLPELSTCVIAAMKKQTDIVLGNIIGSNLFNILIIIGITAAIAPIEVSHAAAQLVSLDIWVMFAVSLAFALILMFYKKINRFVGIVFLGAYALYMGTIFALYLT